MATHLVLRCEHNLYTDGFERAENYMLHFIRIEYLFYIHKKKRKKAILISFHFDIMLRAPKSICGLKHDDWLSK